jgi:hypothetical protein
MSGDQFEIQRQSPETDRSNKRCNAGSCQHKSDLFRPSQVCVWDGCSSFGMAFVQDITQTTIVGVSCDGTIDRAVNMESFVQLVLVIVILRAESVVKRFVCINEHRNFKAICFQFLSKVFQVNHHLFVRIDLDSCSLIGILCSVLLLECRGVTRIMIVTNSIDCNDGKLFVILAKTDVPPSSTARRIFSRPYDAASPMS